MYRVCHYLCKEGNDIYFYCCTSGKIQTCIHCRDGDQNESPGGQSFCCLKLEHCSCITYSKCKHRGHKQLQPPPNEKWKGKNKTTLDPNYILETDKIIDIAKNTIRESRYLILKMRKIRQKKKTISKNQQENVKISEVPTEWKLSIPNKKTKFPLIP